MKADTVKLWFTYSTALVLVIGGFAFLYLTRNDPASSNTPSLIPLIAGFVSAAITFLFQREAQTTTARQVERATAAGAATAAPTTQTVSVPTADTVNVNPPANGDH